jgi:colanic acid/amylovoran biosynthesis protein
LAQFIDRLIVGGYQVVLVPQVTSPYLADDDRLVEKRIVDYCVQDPVRIDESMTCHEVAMLYRSCEYVVGTRFHSVIFSLAALVPCIAIEYEHKTRGIMSDLGLERWVVKMEDVSVDVLDELFRSLVGERRGYKALLNARMPLYIEQASEFPRALKTLAGDRR